MKSNKRKSAKKHNSKPVVELVKSTYQPSKKELNEDMRIANATPEEVARALLRSVDVRFIPRPKQHRP